jgi:hypothetical protein
MGQGQSVYKPSIDPLRNAQEGSRNTSYKKTNLDDWKDPKEQTPVGGKNKKKSSKKDKATKSKPKSSKKK